MKENDIFSDKPLEKEYLTDQYVNNIEKYIIAYLDIDNFRYINDSFGHSFGDKLIGMYGERLRKAMGENGMVYKSNCDEFIILFHKQQKKYLDEKVKSILSKMSQRFMVNHDQINLTTSMGVYIPKENDSIEDAIRKAYIALHEAKEKEKGSYTYFTGSAEEKLIRKILIATELQKSIERNCEGLSIVYQPILNIKEKKVEEVEALLRWNHKELGNISPAEFIPVAEETGIIRKLGYWLIEKILRQIAAWNREGLNVKVAINISPKQIEEVDFLRNIKMMIKNEEIDYRQIKFEITETQIFQLAKENLQDLTELVKSGVDIVLDDFGVGYSSIKNLVFFPIKEMKIDKCFIDFIDRDEKVQKWVSLFISYAHMVGNKVVAEGVERKEQFEKLKEYGCDKIQGYYFARPIHEKEIVKLVKDHNQLYSKDFCRTVLSEENRISCIYGEFRQDDEKSH
jgi:diguanylate cyclase (GGDEF)-like protein